LGHKIPAAGRDRRLVTALWEEGRAGPIFTQMIIQSVSRMAGPVLLLALAGSLGRAQEAGNRDGRLTARPRAATSEAASGFSALSIGRERDALLYVPPGAKAGPIPLVVLLHGAGGSASGMRNRMFAGNDSVEFAVLIPDSRGPTWDAIRGRYGPDIAFIDSALKVTFSRVSVDPSRVIVSGFSDGASYALALGRINGDLFSRVVAFSPGFVPSGSPTGLPEIYITHGNDDRILPYDATSARIVPLMKRAGYSVTLKVFEGGHTVPADLSREAFRWAISTATRPR
jgi:phospholipase/carboxylesterase